jgi:uncharacterized protein (UPF0332 family)
VSKALTPVRYIEKALRALEGARVLLDTGNTEGACSRAYYAMFDATHAALRATGIVAPDAEIKTHNGLLTLFSKELVRTKRIDDKFNKVLNQVQQLRLVADYTGEPPEVEKAQWAVEQAEDFVAAIRNMIERGSP